MKGTYTMFWVMVLQHQIPMRGHHISYCGDLNISVIDELYHLKCRCDQKAVVDTATAKKPMLLLKTGEAGRQAGLWIWQSSYAEASEMIRKEMSGLF